MKHYTTVEQSKKLLELGMNPESADMIYTMVNGRCTPFIRIETIDEVEEDDVFCWSLGALLELMPERVSIKGEASYNLALSKTSSGYTFTYGSYKRIIDNVTTIGLTPIEAAFNMVVWLLENNYLKTQKDKDYSLMDRIDEIKANSVSDEEFEKTWGKSLDETVNKASKAWDDKLKNHKPKDNKDD